MKVVIAASSSRTFLKAPFLIALPVISAKKRSTRFTQDEEVGVKCMGTRGWATRPEPYPLPATIESLRAHQREKSEGD